MYFVCYLYILVVFYRLVSALLSSRLIGIINETNPLSFTNKLIIKQIKTGCWATEKEPTISVENKSRNSEIVR